MGNKAKKPCKFLTIMLAPFKILSKIASFYTMCMEDCNGKIGQGYGGVAFCPVGQVMSIPRSFTVNSLKAREEEEARELLRLVSKRISVSEVESNLFLQSSADQVRQTNIIGSNNNGPNGMRRNYSIGVGKIGRIEEDMPCSFEEDLLYPRSRSCAFQRNCV